MGIYDFNILSDHDKYHIVFTKGQFVDTYQKETLNTFFILCLTSG